MPGFPNGHALIIGVGKYSDTHFDVPTAARDARDLTAALRDQHAAAYPPDQVVELTDAQATLAGVKAALARLADRATPDSTVLISFTCHGARGEDNLYYLATYDVRFAGETIVKNSGLSTAELGKALREIRSPRVLLLLNACFAGLAGPSLTAGGIAAEAPIVGQMLPDESGNELVNSGEGRAIIAAGRPDQRSYFLVGEPNSFFGGALLAALRGGASGAVGLFDLYNAVFRDVSGAAARRLNVAQEPTLTLLQGVGAFPIAAPRGDGAGQVSQSRPAGVVREVPPVVFNITQKSSVIDFGGATIMGDVRTGNVVQGDLTIYGDRPAQPAEDEPVDPLKRLPILRKRVEVARNVDEGDKAEAIAQLDLAEGSLKRGDRDRALRQINAALTILRAMNNGYINSAIRNIEELARAI